MEALGATRAKHAWPMVRLGDVCEFRRGLTYAKADEVEHSSKIVLRSNNIDLETGLLDFSELKYLREDFQIPDDKRIVPHSLLMCMANGSKPHLGKVALIEDDLNYAFGGFMGLILPNGIVPKYLFFALASPSFKQCINQLQSGANINNLKFSDIEDYSIPLPPLPVQREIVERLERELAEADSLAANFKRIAELADAEFKAELDETFRRIKGERIRLGDVCETISTRGHQIKQCEIFSSGQYPVVSQSENFIEGYSDREIVVDENEVVLFGDHTCCVKYIDFPFIVGADGTKLLKSDAMIMKYLALALMYLRPMIDDGKYRRHFSDLIQQNLLIPSLSTQRSIVSQLDAAKARCEKLKTSAERGLRASATLRAAILSEAFAP